MPLNDTLPDALAEALGKIVTDCRREWLSELELLRAERRALVAELRLAAAGIATPAPASEPPRPTAAAKVAKPKSGVRA